MQRPLTDVRRHVFAFLHFLAHAWATLATALATKIIRHAYTIAQGSLVTLLLLLCILLLGNRSRTQPTAIHSALPLPPHAAASTRTHNPLPLLTQQNTLATPERPVLHQVIDKQKQTASMTTHAALAWKKATIKAGDSPIRLFKRLNLSLVDLHDILLLHTHAIKHLKTLRPHQTLYYQTNAAQQLLALKLPLSAMDALIIQKSANGFAPRIIHHTGQKKLTFGQATIRSAFYKAAYQAGLNDNMIAQLATMFKWDIDFSRDIRPNDNLQVLYDTYWLNGKQIKKGPILAAQIRSRGKIYQVVRFTTPEGEVHYYTPKGSSVQRAFLRTPVKYTRISSRFTTGRYHPVLHRIRAHKGVDYAAPYGTPIHATGAGKLAFMGEKGGYGKAIIINHGNHYTTLYGHLSRFAKDIRIHNTIQQGQIIGYVGQTGLATGPHVHYEYRINGIHRDPLSVKLPYAHTVPTRYRNAFLMTAQAMLSELQTHQMGTQPLKKQHHYAAANPPPPPPPDATSEDPS